MHVYIAHTYMQSYTHTHAHTPIHYYLLLLFVCPYLSIKLYDDFYVYKTKNVTFFYRDFLAWKKEIPKMYIHFLWTLVRPCSFLPQGLDLHSTESSSFTWPFSRLLQGGFIFRHLSSFPSFHCKEWKTRSHSVSGVYTSLEGRRVSPRFVLDTALHDIFLRLRCTMSSTCGFG